MSVKLSFGEPVVVSYGPAYAEAGWGTHQFPAVRRLPDGRIVVSYHIVNDTTEDYGLERGWAVSSDEGHSFSPVSPQALPAIKARFGTRLPSGKYLRGITPKPFKIDDALHAALTKKMGRRKFCLGVEEIPDGLFEKDKWIFAISGPDSLEEEAFFTDLDFPGMTLGLTTGAIIRPFSFGPIRVAPDGSVWIAHYSHGRNPENLGFTSFYACYYFRSTDEGKSFGLQSWNQYLPDTRAFPDAFTTEGFCEPDICFMPDGGMITLMRTGSLTPSYIARSADNGKTWSEPVQFDRCGVLPQLLHLKCGVTLSSYGRPGLFVRATDDPSGMKWDAPVELMPYDVGQVGKDSCCYTELLALDDRTALMAYTDFNVDDGTGTRRKTVLVRTIHVV